MNVLLVTSEVKPFSETGGLGDVAGALPKYLSKIGVNIKVISPFYYSIKEKKSIMKKMKKKTSIKTSFGNKKENCNIYTYQEDNKNSVEYIFIENSWYYDREEIYGYADDYKRFAYLSKVALEVVEKIDFKVDIIHCNDWQSALVPIYLKNEYIKKDFYKNIKTILTIHNLQYQGIMNKDKLGEVGLDESYFNIEKLEFFGEINILKGGLVFSDLITTVSNTYAKEIQKEEFGFGLNGIVKELEDKIIGIVNGIDYEVIDPEKEELPINFSIESLEKKELGKKQLLKKLKLNDTGKPLVGMVTRLATQKGIDLIPEKTKDLGIQLVVLGTGEEIFENKIKKMEKINKGEFKGILKYNSILAKEIFAYSDFFLMPSKFEPCGLGQLYALRYGTVPIVRNTGGLSDTISHYNRETMKGDGIVFDHSLESAVEWGILESVKLYKEKEHFKKAIKNGMEKDYSWNNSAEIYKEIYINLIK